MINRITDALKNTGYFTIGCAVLTTELLTEKLPEACVYARDVGKETVDLTIEKIREAEEARAIAAMEKETKKHLDLIEAARHEEAMLAGLSDP